MLGSQQWTGKLSEDSSPMRGLGRLARCPGRGSHRLTLKVLSQCDGEIAWDPGCLRWRCLCREAWLCVLQSQGQGDSVTCHWQELCRCCDDAFPVVAAEPNLATLPE
jgi:hypothetical protein